MDPNVTLAEMLAALAEGGTADFMDRANDLASWIEKDGFKPEKLDEIVELLTVSKPAPQYPNLWVARLYVLVEAKGENEASDAISAAMSENLKYGGAIENWSYTKDDAGRYTYAVQVPRQIVGSMIEDCGGVDTDEIDFDRVWNDSYPYPS